MHDDLYSCTPSSIPTYHCLLPSNSTASSIPAPSTSMIVPNLVSTMPGLKPILHRMEGTLCTRLRSYKHKADDVALQMTSSRILPIQATSRGGNEYPHLLRLTSLPLKSFASRRAMTSSTHIQCRGRSAAKSYSARAAQYRWSRITQLKTDDPHAGVYRSRVFFASGKDEIRRLQ